MRLGTRPLDVLVLDPHKKWLLAVEHKYGAPESKGQLSDYRKGLEKLFPDWTRVLVFLDWYGQAPSDVGWIGIDYSWLIDELNSTLSSPWLASSCKSVLQDFKNAVDWNAPAFEHVADEELFDVVAGHGVVFQRMLEWYRPGNVLVSATRDLCESTTADAQLFKVYWQRRWLWNACMDMLPYAAWVKNAKAVFPDVMHWPDRRSVYFHLPVWSDVAAAPEAGDDSWAVAVCVFPLANEEVFGKDTFEVQSYILPRRWKSDLLAAHAGRLQEYREKTMKKHVLVSQEKAFVLRSQKRVARDGVTDVLGQHLRGLSQLMGEIKADLRPQPA